MSLIETTAPQPVWEMPVDEIMFTHPDGVTDLDSSPDPIRDICRLQAHGGLVPGIGSRFDGIFLPNLPVPPRYADQPSFAAVTWDVARAVYTSDKFCSGHLVESIGALWGPTFGIMDGPDHSKFRQVNQRGFTPKWVKLWEDRFVRPVLDRRVGELRSRGKANLARELNAYYPYEVLGQIAGFEAADIAYVANCFHRINRGQIDPQAGYEASVEIKAYALDLINKRRAEPREDFISVLVDATVDDQPLDDEHFVAFVIHFMQGGIDTVFRMSNNMVYLLLNHPEEMAKLRADRSLIPKAIEEGMRYEGVANIMGRLAVEDTEVLGVPVAKDTMIHLVHPAINRDPARWPDPHRFDITREPNVSMAFGFGAHRCLGMHLARLEMHHFLGHILDDFPNLRWDPEIAHTPKITGWFMRSAIDLPVVWDVA